MENKDYAKIKTTIYLIHIFKWHIISNMSALMLVELLAIQLFRYCNGTTRYSEDIQWTVACSAVTVP